MRQFFHPRPTLSARLPNQTVSCLVRDNGYYRGVTIHNDLKRTHADQDAAEDTRPVTRTTLTKAEVMNAIGYAACLKNGLTGEHNMVVKFRWDAAGDLSSVEVEQRPAPAGSTGQPPLLTFGRSM